MTANVITYRTRSAVREVGKTLGFSPEQVDRLAKLNQVYEFRDHHDDLATLLKRGGVDVEAPRLMLMVDLVRKIQSLPRHLGQHSGGMVIAAQPLDEIVPLEPASMPGRVVIQWDKDDCADLGIIKIDLLGLGMLAALKEAIPLIRDARRRRDRSRASAARRSRRVRDAAARRYRRRFPGREPRADGDAAADEAGAVLRPGGRGRDNSPRPDRRQNGASLSRSPQQARARRVCASFARADPETHARRPAVPGAVAANGDDGRGLQRRRGRGVAPRDGIQALGRDGWRKSKRACAPGCCATACKATSPTTSCARSRPLRCTDFPNRTPPASR